MVLVVAAAIAGMNTVFEEGLRGLGEPMAVFWCETLGLAVTAVSLALLLRPLGIMGAAMASILGYSATGFLTLLRIRRNTSQSLSALLLIKADDVALISRKFRDICAPA